MKKLIIAALVAALWIPSIIAYSQPAVQVEVPQAPVRITSTLKTLDLKELGCMRQLNIQMDKEYFPFARKLFNQGTFCCDKSGTEQTECLQSHRDEVNSMKDYARMLNHNLSEQFISDYESVCMPLYQEDETPQQIAAGDLYCQIRNLYYYDRAINTIIEHLRESNRDLIRERNEAQRALGECQNQ